MDWVNLIAFATLFVGGGGFLFYSQKKSSMEIANAAQLAAEWEKLYREQKSISDKNGENIGRLTEKVNLLTIRVEKAEPFICTDTNCERRINHFINKILNNEKE